MKNTDLLNALRNADPRFVRETEQRAADAALPKQRRWKPVLIAAAGAAACLGAVLFLLHKSPRQDDLLTVSNDPAEQITEALAENTEIAPETTEFYSTELTTIDPLDTQTTTATEQLQGETMPGCTEQIVTDSPEAQSSQGYAGTVTGITNQTTASTQGTPASTTRVTHDDFQASLSRCRVHVISFDSGEMIVRPDDGAWELRSSDRFSLPVSYLPAGKTPSVGMWLEVMYSGYIGEIYPAIFSGLYSVSVLDDMTAPTESVKIGQNEVYVWHDLIQEQITPTQAFDTNGEYRIRLAAFPDTEFIWRHYGIYYNKNGTETRILGSSAAAMSNTITPWQVYITDMTGDGLPDLCINYCMGSDFFCTQNVYVYDYYNDESYGIIGNRGTYDYVFRYRNNQMYVEEIPYSAHPALQFAGMTGTLGKITIPSLHTSGVIDFIPES